MILHKPNTRSQHFHGAGGLGTRRPRRSVEPTGAGKSTCKPTRSSSRIQMTSDCWTWASPKDGSHNISSLPIYIAIITWSVLVRRTEAMEGRCYVVQRDYDYCSVPILLAWTTCKIIEILFAGLSDVPILLQFMRRNVATTCVIWVCPCTRLDL
jgi:hypothetical protein